MARRRGRLATLAAAILLATGCGDGVPDGGGSPAPSVEGCAPEERPPLQAGSHLIGDTDPPVPYSSVPPTSGWHASGAPSPGVNDEPLSDPQIVALLERGQVVAVYDPDALDDEAISRLEELATSVHEERLSVTPANTRMPAPLTLTAWGVLQRCETVAAEAVTAFVVTHYGQTGAEH